MAKIKTIGILTSGGDAPGMNAAIRAVTRAGIYNGFEIKGIYRGYEGLITGDIKSFTTENVSGIIGQGGTILKTARSKSFATIEGRQQAYDNLVKEGIDALVVIGGNGSLTGAMIFAQEFDFCCIGLPGTIDNPEDSTNVDQLGRFMERGIRKSKRSCIVIVSESPKCGAMYYADRVRKEFPDYDVRVSILGHLQRGGRPSARDRILASSTGVGAIEAILQGQRNIMVGVRNNEVVYVPLSEAIRSDKPFDRKLIKVLDELSI